MRKTFRTLSLMMVVLFALSILPGGKWLSSASATTDPMPLTATAKTMYGGLYTDTVYLPYTGQTVINTNEINGIHVDMRDYDFYLPTQEPLTASGWGAAWWVTPSPVTPGANVCTFNWLDFCYLSNGVVIGYLDYMLAYGKSIGLTDDGFVSDSITVNLIKPVTKCYPTTATVTTSGPEPFPYIEFELPITPPNLTFDAEMRYSLTTATPGAVGFQEDVSSDKTKVKLPLICTSPGTLTIRCTYSFDTYDSGWWDWAETIPYNKNADGSARAVPRQSIYADYTVTFVAAP